MVANFPIPWQLVPRIAAASLAHRTRSFRRDSIMVSTLLNPPLEIRGQEKIPMHGPYLVTTNHFSYPGFNAWWLTLAVSSVLPVEVHWIMTGAMIYPGKFYETPMRILTTWAFRRVAQVYSFTNMPPVPPYSYDVEGRARAVRRILQYAASAPEPVIGLAPEGTDHPGGSLGVPPPGSGRLVAHLAAHCRVILPVGIFVNDDHLCVQFGECYSLQTPDGLSRKQLDLYVSQIVMRTIAHQLPVSLSGEFWDEPPSAK